MIILVNILERGNDYVVFTMKGAELQETTVCHAEENENINEITDTIFNKKQTPCNFTFSLAPIKQIQFSLYDDIKFSLTGTVDNPMFAEIVKTYFMRICAFKFAKLFGSN